MLSALGCYSQGFFKSVAVFVVFAILPLLSLAVLFIVINPVGQMMEFTNTFTSDLNSFKKNVNQMSHSHTYCISRCTHNKKYLALAG